VCRYDKGVIQKLHHAQRGKGVSQSMTDCDSGRGRSATAYVTPCCLNPSCSYWSLLLLQKAL